MEKKPTTEDLVVLYDLLFRPLLVAVSLHALIAKGHEPLQDAVVIADIVLKEMCKEK